MEKIRLGRTGMMVSRLGFGSIPIQRASDDEALAVINKCMELGITYIDTANGYTTSEERIGRAISGRRDEVIIATKSHAQTREGIESDLKLSLKRFGVEYIDLYQFHNIRSTDALERVLEPNGVMDVILEAKKAGIVRHIGASSHSLDTAKEIVKSDRFETIQFPFNFITCEAADELLPLTREHDVGFIAMKPLAGGRLDNATLAFKYLFQFPDVVPIPGIYKTHEIEEIVQIMEQSLAMTVAEQREMEQLKQELGTRFCRRCDYCQPCPEGILISDVLVFPSLLKIQTPERLFMGTFSKPMEKAANCAECGECEEKCPYHLPIREMVAEYVKQYQAEKKKFLEQTASK
ncbi:aldo/keto reductase [Chloroflexota bacterium]